jgi:hypothetical protein
MKFFSSQEESNGGSNGRGSVCQGNNTEKKHVAGSEQVCEPWLRDWDI